MKTAIVVPNWNGADLLRDCVDSLLAQSHQATLVIVDNGSTDESRKILESYGDKLVCLYNDINLGFAGGVNTGIRYALENDYQAVALFNNDAVADEDWLRHLVAALKDDVGIATCSFQSIDKQHIDSTGDQFTTWGLPYPRGRGKKVSDFATETETAPVFGASGGATLYSIPMLRQVGLFDEDFFAYFEDVDISFRAQLAGWKAVVNPRAKAYHHISVTSNRFKGFATYQSLKNWPLTIIKDVPAGLMSTVLPRFILAYVMFIVSAIVIHRHPIITIKALWKVLTLLPKKLRERKDIQARKTVTDQYILSIMTHDLPENADKLRKLRALWWKLNGKAA